MKIGVNTLFHVPGDVGGTETYLRELLVNMVCEFADISLTLFTHLDNDRLLREMFEGNSRVHFVTLGFHAKNRPLRIVVEQTLLPWAVYRSGVDLLWSPGYTAPLVSTCPQVVTIHDLQYKKHPEDLTFAERFTLDFLVKAACRRCDKVIAVSEFSRQEIIDYGFAPAQKVEAVLEGVDPSFADTVSWASVSQELNSVLPPDQPYILCVAHTYPHKNVHLLIEAFSNVQEKIPHKLVLVGKPRLGEPLVADAILRVGKTVRLHRLADGVSSQGLKYLYQNADLFVLPSEYEGFGLPVLEAMMAGTPVITTKAGAIREVAASYAFCIETIDSEAIVSQILVMTTMSVEERAAKVRAAKQWAETFTWKKSAHSMIENFRFLIQQS